MLRAVASGVASALIGATVLSPSGDTTGATDTTNILNAISAAGTAGGGYIRLAAGTWYRDDRQIDLVSNLRLEGSGIGVTVILSVASASANIFRALNPITNFSISHMTLNWQRSLKTVDLGQGDFNKNCIYLVASTNYEIANTELINANFHGLISDFSGSGANIHDNICSGNGNRGLHIHGDISTGAPVRNIISDNYLYQNGQKNNISMIVTGTASSGTNVINISHADALLLAAAFTSASSTGVALVTGGGLTASDLFSIVTAVDSTANTVTITNNLQTAINGAVVNIGMALAGGLFVAFEGTTDTIISNNLVYLDGGYGIAITNTALTAKNTVCTGNVIDGCWGGSLLGANNTHFNENTIVNSVFQAIQVGSLFNCDGMQIKNNTIDTAGAAGIGYKVIVNSRGADISGNTIKNCGAAGVYLYNASTKKIVDVSIDSNIVETCGTNATFSGSAHYYAGPVIYGKMAIATAVGDFENISINCGKIRECIGGAVYAKQLVNFKVNGNISTDNTAVTSGSSREMRVLGCTDGEVASNQFYKLTRTNTDSPLDVGNGSACTNVQVHHNYTNRTREGAFGNIMILNGTGVVGYDNVIPAPGVFSLSGGATIRFYNPYVDAFKNADLTIASANTTLTNDTELLFAIANGEKWAARFVLDVGAALSTTGLKLAVTVPAGATLNVNAALIPDVDSIIATEAFVKRTTTSGTALDFTTGTLASAGDGKLMVDVYVANSTTAGTVNIQWAQSAAASGVNLLIRKGSEMGARRVA